MIVAFETVSVRAAMTATADIPIVFVTADDPWGMASSRAWRIQAAT